ncbi:Mesoderm induction early response protein 3 [Lamellibrachia satsuma]|nr:Mesoderm induction early response protein 3 [Lamellibrachia satsuma]
MFVLYFQQTTSESSPDTDRDFDPSADMLVDDIDDERTMEEEEALSNEDSVGKEVDDLQKESEMPIEELLALYRRQYSSPEPVQSDLHDARSSSEEEILSNQDLTLDKEQIGRDLLTNVDEDGPTSADELLDSVNMEIHSDMERMLRCKLLYLYRMTVFVKRGVHAAM